MAPFEILVIIAALAVAAGVLALLLRDRRGDPQAALRQEIQSLLAGQAHAVTTQMQQLTQTVTQQLGQVTQVLQSGVASAGQLTAEAQKAMAAQLQASGETLGKLRQELGEVQQAGRELAGAAHTIEMVLGGARTRGALGEVALERLLADTLPQGTYETQYRFSSGEAVDAAVRLRDKLLPIDSKFPLEAYQRIAEKGEEARKEFAQAVRAHTDSIAKKYIVPQEGTLEIALMFVPSESVYYELLMTADAKGTALDAYCRTKSVIPVSPNTLYAHLNVILMGLRGMQIEENARQLLGRLAGLKKQFDGFAEVYEKLGTHLRNAQQNYADADLKLERARGALEQLSQGALPETPAKALEAATKD
jgi:DNA recombination protein RmuC